MSSRTTKSHIYIGPSVPPIGLKKYTLYLTEHPPESLKRHALDTPALYSLYVPTSRLAVAAANLLRPGSVEHHADLKMQEIAKTIPR